MAKKLLVCILLFIALLTTGCWDRKELQEKNFVLAVAIDKADAGYKPGLKEKEQADVSRTETFVQLAGQKKYRLSLQILKLGSGGGDEKDKSKTYVISNTGHSFFEMIRDMTGQVSKSLWFEHIQVIVISDAVLKESHLAEVLDFFIRDAEMRTRIKVYITPGEARPFLEYVPKSKEASGIYLATIIGQSTKNFHIPGARTDLGMTTQYFDNKMDVILPKIEMVGDVVKVGGAAVFKKDNFAGYLDEYGVAGAKMIIGTEKSAVLALPCPDHPENIVLFELYRHDTRLRPYVDNEKVYFVLDINMYGNIGEMQGDNELHNVLKDIKYKERFAQAVADEVKRNVLYSYRAQQALGVDVIEFVPRLKAYQPETWKKIKDNWDQVYPEIPLVVSVNINIRNAGEHK